jgi:hypothetical protein
MGTRSNCGSRLLRSEELTGRQPDHFAPCFGHQHHDPEFFQAGEVAFYRAGCAVLGGGQFSEGLAACLKFHQHIPAIGVNGLSQRSGAVRSHPEGIRHRLAEVNRPRDRAALCRRLIKNFEVIQRNSWLENNDHHYSPLQN